jgi:hypothetical protein
MRTYRRSRDGIATTAAQDDGGDRCGGAHLGGGEQFVSSFIGQLETPEAIEAARQSERLLYVRAALRRAPVIPNADSRLYLDGVVLAFPCSGVLPMEGEADGGAIGAADIYIDEI